MSNEPDRESPVLERSLTVPLLVRGGLDPRLLAVTLVLSAMLAVGGTLAYASRTRDREVPWVLWSGAFALALGTGLVAVWFVPRRRWIEVTLTGFVLTERGRRQAFADEAVVGLTRRFTTDTGKAFHHQVRLEIDHGGKTETVDCSYNVPSGLADPLAGFWDRLVDGIARRLRTALPSGGTLSGEGWHLDARGLHHCGNSVELGRITRVSYFDEKLCVWKGDDERAFLRLPSASRNVQPLGRLLHESCLEPPTMPAQPLGRVLIDRRNLDWALGIFLVVVGLGVLFFLSSAVYSRAMTRPLFALAPVAWVVLVGPVAIAKLRRGRTTRVIFHERGVSQPTPEGTRSMLYEEIDTIRWQPGPCITLTALDGLDRPTIKYTASISPSFDDLGSIRELLCGPLARRWAKELSVGPVRWSPRLRFLPGGLEYTPGGLLGTGEPTTVPYHLTSYLVENSVFRLYVNGEVRAVCKEGTGLPNFFVGLLLLEMIYRSQRQPAGLPPAPRPSGDSRITTAHSMGHVTPGERGM